MDKQQIKDKIQNTYFVNLNAISYGTVFKTQVLSWLKIYDDYGIHFDLITIESLKSLLTGKMIFDEQLVRKDFNNRFMRIYTAKTGSSISDFLVLIFLWSLLRKPLKLKKKIVLQTRSEVYCKSLRILKKWLGKRLQIVYDSRGSLPEEFRYAFFDKSESPDMKIKIETMRQNEKTMVNLADRVFCVSHALRKYHMKNNPQVPESKFFVSPCNADPKLFHYDIEIRNALREKLSIADRKVLVYSGGLESPWHIPDSVFDLFSKLYPADEQLTLLLLTQDGSIARDLQKKHNIPDERIKIYTIDNKEVSAYLNAADWGILLRDDMPVNNVASPTKFAEYLMTGLPVIISPNVGDFSTFVIEQNVGCIIPTPFSDKDLTVLKTYLTKETKPKDEIASLGKAHFSKLSNIEPKINLYVELAEKE